MRALLVSMPLKVAPHPLVAGKVKFEAGYHAQTGGQGDALKFGINPMHRKKVVEQTRRAGAVANLTLCSPEMELWPIITNAELQAVGRCQ